jgi:hypothetical protein
MHNFIEIPAIEEKIISIRNSQVILDFEVAILYGVETKHVNQAVKNNPDKFPLGYVLELNEREWQGYLRSKILTANNHFKSRVLPKAFTEKGLYMLATILRSPEATNTTIAIIETFTKIRNLNSVVSSICIAKNQNEQKNLLQQASMLMNELMGDSLHTKDTETTIELNLALLKLKHTVKRK